MANLNKKLAVAFFFFAGSSLFLLPAHAIDYFCPPALEVIPFSNASTRFWSSVQFKNAAGGVTTALFADAGAPIFACSATNIRLNSVASNTFLYTQDIDCKNIKTPMFTGSTTSSFYQLKIGEIYDNLIASTNPNWGSDPVNNGLYIQGGVARSNCSQFAAFPAGTTYGGSLYKLTSALGGSFSDTNIVSQLQNINKIQTDNVLYSIRQNVQLQLFIISLLVIVLIIGIFIVLIR